MTAPIHKEMKAANMMTFVETQNLGFRVKKEIVMGYIVVSSAVATIGFVSWK
jgi:hypothetical protein